MITSLDEYIAAPKDTLEYVKTVGITTGAGIWSTLIDIAGSPGAGVLNAGNTINGIIPTRAFAGFPNIRDYPLGKKGYLSKVAFGCSVAARFKLIDRLYNCGAYNFNDNVILDTQPDFSSRLPNASYRDIHLWVEVVTALTGGAYSITVIYTNQDGVPGRTTGAVVVGATSIRRLIRLGLQAGDYGVQKIEQVIAAGGTGGTFNLVLARELWNGRSITISGGDTHSFEKTSLIEIPQEAALQPIIAPDGASSGIPELQIEISHA